MAIEPKGPGGVGSSYGTRTTTPAPQIGSANELRPNYTEFSQEEGFPVVAQTNPLTGEIGFFIGSIAAGTVGELPGKSRMSIAVIGDSRAANHVAGTSQFSGRGAVAWASLKLNGKLRFSTADVYGVSTTYIYDNRSGLLSAYNQLATLTKQYDFIAAICAVNDVFNGASSGKMIADMTAVIYAIFQKGSTPILFTEVVTTGMSAAQRTVVDRYNSWLRSCVVGKRILLIDAYAICVDWTSATCQPLGSGAAQYLYDGLHFAPVAAEKIGNSLVATLDKWMPAQAMISMASREDAYDATNRPYGNLLGIQGAFGASGGANRDGANDVTTASTGTVALGSRLYKTPGALISVVGAVGTSIADIQGNAIALPVQNIKITAGGTGYQTCQFQLPGISTNIAPGDVVCMSGWINIKGATGLQAFSPYVQEQNGSYVVQQTTSVMSGFQNSSVYYPPVQDVKAFYFESPPMTLTAAAVYLRAMLDIQVDGATANVEIEIANVSVHKVDPLQL